MAVREGLQASLFEKITETFWAIVQANTSLRERGLGESLFP